MKKRKYILQICLSLFLLFGSLMLKGIDNVNALTSSSTTFVGIEYSKDDKYELEVIIKGNGYIHDGKEINEASRLIYQMPLETFKEFTIYANKGSRLKSIHYYLPEFDRDENISTTIKNNKLKVFAESTKMQVIIEFEKAYGNEDANDNTMTKPNSVNKTPQTGDKGLRYGVYLGFLMIALLAIVGIEHRKSKE